MLNTLNKMIKRIWKLLIYRRKVFGTVGKNNTFDWSVYVNEDAKIGSNNYFGPYSMVNNAIIGNFCSIGPSVKIGQGMHSLEFYTTYQRLSKQIINHTLNTIPAIIGNDVWIGANAIVMQDVKIGNGAVIGANAVVTKDIPSYAIAVGVPAKVIKYRFSEEQIIKIQESGWDKMNFSDAKITLEQLYTNNRKKK